MTPTDGTQASEAEIASLAALGLSNDEIAERLGVDPAAVASALAKAARPTDRPDATPVRRSA